MASYYTNLPFINTQYSIDIAIENHFNSFLFPEEVDLSRIIYSFNSYAFRKRAETQENNNLNLPFMNYKLVDYDFSQETWWNNEAYSRGFYIPELQDYVQYSPITLQYEASFWCHRDDELRYAFTQLRWDSDSKTTIQGSVSVDSLDVDIPGQLGYTNLQFEPNYVENDWLERNKIHSASMNFEVVTWMLRKASNQGIEICIPTKIIFDFTSLHGIDDNTSYEERLEFFQDYFAEDVYDSPYLPDKGIVGYGNATTSFTI